MVGGSQASISVTFVRTGLGGKYLIFQTCLLVLFSGSLDASSAWQVLVGGLLLGVLRVVGMGFLGLTPPIVSDQGGIRRRSTSLGFLRFSRMAEERLRLLRVRQTLQIHGIDALFDPFGFALELKGRGRVADGHMIEQVLIFFFWGKGGVRRFVPEWLEIGLDVLHPIQKYAMDEAAIAREYGGQMTVFSGMEVQQVIPWGTPDEVRAEVRFLMDTFWRKGEGRCM